MSVDTFPLVGTPTTGFAQFDAVVSRRQAGGLLASGRDLVVDLGAPQWSLTAKTVPLLYSQLAKWRAWKAKLRGAARFFTMWDPTNEYPQAYMPQGWGNLTRATGGSFDGTATLTTIGNSGLPDGGRDVLTFGTLPNALQMTPSDTIQVTTAGGLVSLHRVLDDPAPAANSGGNLTVWVEPGLPIGYTTAAVAQFHRASAKWRVISLDIPPDAQGRNRPAVATLTAVSVQL